MYINYVANRKELKYECVIDTECGEELVLIVDSSVLSVNNAVLDGKRKIILSVGIIVLVFHIFFIGSAEAIGMPLFHQKVVHISHRDSNKLIESKLMKPNKNTITMPKMKLVRITRKSDLRSSKWLKKFVYSIRGGDNEKLILSILSKVAETDLDLCSINKILIRLAEITVEIGANQNLLRILVEMEKPAWQSSVFVNGFVNNPLPRHTKKNEVQKNRHLDLTKSYNHREGFNMPREISENFESNSIKKLYTDSLKNPKLKKEYEVVKNSIEQGIHPVNLSGKSTYVSSTKVLVKKSQGRYLMKVSDVNVKVIALSSRTNDKYMEKFKDLINKQYNLKIKGY